MTLAACSEELAKAFVGVITYDGSSTTAAAQLPSAGIPPVYRIFVDTDLIDGNAPNGVITHTSLNGVLYEA